MDPILLLGSILLIAAALTWILPAGQFTRKQDPATGRTVVTPGSYRAAQANPVGIWGAMQSIPEGLAEAGEVVFFVFLAGAAITVVEATGAISNFLNAIMRSFGGRPMLVLAIASILFLIGGASHNMYEEIIAFLPLLILLIRRLRMDPVIALGVSVGTSSVAAIFSPFNTFTLGISQPMAQLPLFSGFAFRAVFFLIAMTIWAAHLAWWVKRYPVADPSAGTVEVDDAGASPAGAWNWRDIGVLTILNGGMVLIVAGGVWLHWGLSDFGAVFVLMGLAAGLVGGLGLRGTAEHLAEGIRQLAFAGVLVGLARAVSVVLRNGAVLDTIANALFAPLQALPVSVAAVMMFLAESVLAFPMSSDSGRAMMSLPILLPLADLLGMSRQAVVLAYQYSGLVSNLVTPTAGALLAMLSIAGIPYGRWLRFIAVPVALLAGLSAAALVLAVEWGGKAG